MPPIISLMKYSYTTRRSPALVVYSALAAVWAVGWLVLWTIGVVYAEPNGEGGPVGFLAGVCAWFILVVAFCLLPVVIQFAWAMKVQKEEAEENARASGYYYAAPGAPAYPPAQPGFYPPPAAVAGFPETDRLLEEKRRRSRELEYENSLLKQRLRDQETRRRSMTTVEKLVEAQGLELEKRYGEAAQAYEEMGRWEDASRVRTLQGKGGDV
jgi:hypothetical protein